MKISFKHVPLVIALDKLYKIASVASKSTAPNQGAFLFTVKKTATLITANNLEIVGNIAVFCLSNAEGVFVLPVEAFNVIKTFTVESVDFEISNNILTITGGFDKITYVLNEEKLFTRPVKEYKQGMKSIPISSEILLSFERAMAFTFYDEMRPVFESIVINIEDQKMRIYATTGSILYKNTFNCPGIENTGNVMIPRQLHSSIRGLKKDDKTILMFSNDWIGIKSSSTGSEFYCRALTATAPAYERVIPTETTMNFTVDNKELTKAVKIALAIDSGVTNAVILSLNGKFDIMRENNQAGAKYRTSLKHEGKLPVEPFVTAFGPKLFEMGVDAFNSTAIQIQFTTPMKATLLHPIVEGKPTQEVVVMMPVKAIPDAIKTV